MKVSADIFAFTDLLVSYTETRVFSTKDNLNESRIVNEADFWYAL